MENIFNNLSKINVNEHTEKRNDLTYLSWSWAWSELKKQYPTATYTIERFGENRVPYLFDEDLGYMVFTSMEINGLTHEMWLPVMDGANKAMKDVEYKYQVKNPSFKYAKKCEDGIYRDNYGREQQPYIEKTVAPATMFDINKTIMRCLTKNISMFGLGLYIYSGEDLPEEEKATPEQVEFLAKCYKDDNLTKFLKANKIQKLEDLSKQRAIAIINDIKEKLKTKENQ